ncbi:MAG: TMEM43 family protein [Rhizomicrobium sp.]
MANQFTEVSSQGFLSRLFGSIMGVFLGPVVIIGAIILLSWNEGRAVHAIIGLNAAEKMLVEAQATAPSSANDGKLVHVVGQASASDTISDSDLNVKFPGQVTVARTAQMYQWQEKKDEHSQDDAGGSQTTTTTYTYEHVWSEDPIDSSRFKHADGHENPAMPFRSSRMSAADARLGGYALDADTLGAIDPPQSVTPDAPEGWQKSGDRLVKGDPAAPKVGDLRVSYRELPSGSTISVLAAQSGGGFATFTAPNGYTIHMASAGNHPATEMIAQQRSTESLITWILRGVGFVVMWIGFSMLLGPLATFASIVPFLGSIVRGAAAFVSFVIAVPLTLIVIAIAWIAFRPLLGGGLLVLAAAAFYALWHWHKSRTPNHGLPSPAKA